METLQGRDRSKALTQLAQSSISNVLAAKDLSLYGGYFILTKRNWGWDFVMKREIWDPERGAQVLYQWILKSYWCEKRAFIYYTYNAKLRDRLCKEVKDLKLWLRRLIPSASILQLSKCYASFYMLAYLSKLRARLFREHEKYLKPWVI
jgi:hypothetical protein